MHEYGNCSELLTHLDDVSCSGTESILTECGHIGVSIRHSSRNEVAAVICSGEECLSFSAAQVFACRDVYRAVFL